MVLTTGPPWKERQPDAPKCSETPLDSLTAKPTDIGLSTWRPFEPYAVGGFIGGAGTVIFVNKLSARPWYSGIHLTLLVGIVCGIAAKAFDAARWERHKEKDDMMREYILLHPEQFPPYNRRKYRDIFEPWVPIR